MPCEVGRFQTVLVRNDVAHSRTAARMEEEHDGICEEHWRQCGFLRDKIVFVAGTWLRGAKGEAAANSSLTGTADASILSSGDS